MDYLLQGMFGDRSLTKVAAVFNDRADAQAMVARLQSLPGMAPGQVRMLRPEDAREDHAEHFGRTLEPEQRGIFRTMIRAHVVTGFAGGVLGLLLYAWLLRSGTPLIASSPLLAFIAVVGFCTTFGLLAGGLVTMRPDHVGLITEVREALEQGRWAVVVHPTDTAQTRQARALLQDGGGAQVARTL